MLDRRCLTPWPASKQAPRRTRKSLDIQFLFSNSHSPITGTDTHFDASKRHPTHEAGASVTCFRYWPGPWPWTWAPALRPLRQEALSFLSPGATKFLALTATPLDMILRTLPLTLQDAFILLISRLLGQKHTEIPSRNSPSANLRDVAQTEACRLCAFVSILGESR